MGVSHGGRPSGWCARSGLEQEPDQEHSDHAAARAVADLDTLTAETGARAIAFGLTSEDSVRDAVDGLDLFGVVNYAGFGGRSPRPRAPTSTCSTRSSA